MPRPVVRRGGPVPSTQRGVGLVGWLLVLAAFGLAALVGLRVAPPYFEALTVSSILDEVADDPEMRDASDTQLRSAVDRRLTVNSVSDLGRGDVEVEDVAGGTRIAVEYERRFHIIANLDGVAQFRREATVPQ